LLINAKILKINTIYGVELSILKYLYVSASSQIQNPLSLRSIVLLSTPIIKPLIFGQTWHFGTYFLFG